MREKCFSLSAQFRLRSITPSDGLPILRILFTTYAGAAFSCRKRLIAWFDIPPSHGDIPVKHNDLFLHYGIVGTSLMGSMIVKPAVRRAMLIQLTL